MTTAAPVPPNPAYAFAPEFARRFSLLMGGMHIVNPLTGGLLALLALRLFRPPLLAIAAPFINRISRINRRVARLLDRLIAGTWSPPHPRPPGLRRARPVSKTATDTTSKPPRLPNGFLWLVRTFGGQAAACKGHLESLLAEPGCAELLDACPTLRRFISPLGRLLGLDAFRPKPRIRKPRPPKATKPPPEPISMGHPDPTYRPSAKWTSGWPRAARKHVVWRNKPA